MTEFVKTNFIASSTGEELKRSEEMYNDAQRKWIDDMISACQVEYTIDLYCKYYHKLCPYFTIFIPLFYQLVLVDFV